MQHAKHARAHLGPALTVRDDAELLQVIGMAEMRRGALPTGIPPLCEALEIAERCGLHDVRAEIQLEFTRILVTQGNAEAALAHATEAREISLAHGLDLLLPRAWVGLGHAKRIEGLREESERCYREGLAIARLQGHPLNIADALRGLGHVARPRLGGRADALALYGESLELAMAAGSLEREAFTVVNLAGTMGEHGDWRGALALLDGHAESSAAGLLRDVRRKNERGRRRAQRRVLAGSGVAVAALLLALVFRRLHNRQLRANRELERAHFQDKRLHGLLPICAHCKAIRDDAGYGRQIGGYLTKHSDAVFSHGLCPSCVQDHDPGLLPQPLPEPVDA